MISIRRRLFLSLLFSFVICIAAMMVYVFFQTRHELTEIFDNNMRETVELLRDTGVSANYAPQARPSDAGSSTKERLILQLWSADGQLLRSMPKNEEIPLNTRLRDGFARSPGHRWQTHTIKTKEGGYIQIARSETMVTHLIEENALQALMPFVILFLLLGAGAWFLIGKSLTPMAVLSGEIASRRAEQLDPIVMEKIPGEIKPIIQALNDLLQKLQIALDMQRRFTADAAHELRTPLTALRLQIDVLKKMESKADREEAIRHLEAGVERSARLVHQLLMASRANADAGTNTALLDLAETTRSVAAAMMPLAQGKTITLTLDLTPGLSLRAGEEQLRSLIGNLLDNAIRYTPEGGQVDVSCSRENDAIIFTVCDSGPGIPVEQREKIFDRFYRMPGTKETGSGLGLAIARDIADRVGAVISIGEGPQKKGTCASIRFEKPRDMPGK